MTENSLQHLSLSELYDLLVETVNAYLSLHRGSNKIAEEKRADLILIHKIITQRKS
jgi:hypothetical protein